MGLKAQIVVVGREVLTGRVRDTNSGEIARSLSELGITLTRIVTVDDDIQAISQEISTAMESGADLVFTVGGLGPTFDDVTLEGVAEATGHRLVLVKEALEFVRARYLRFYREGAVGHPDITPEREKMARLPEESRVLNNPVGTAPGVMLDHAGVVIICLPGVPAEMKAILEGSVLPYLESLPGKGVTLEGTVATGYRDESALTIILRQVMAQVPGVHLKSCPTGFGQEEGMKVVISATGEEETETRKRLEMARSEILKRL